jgi:error-prone DNA polymerase
MSQEVPFAELVAATNYSFLRGASHPSDMIIRAVELGMTGIGIADRNSVAGVVRAWSALRQLQAAGHASGFRLVTGARLVFADGTPDIAAYPMTRKGWGRLTRLLSLGNLRAEKGNCILRLDDLLEWADEIAMIVLPARAPRPPHRNTEADILRQLRARISHLWLAASMPRAGSDKRRLAMLASLAKETAIPLLATNDALYSTPQQRPLHDILTCIAEKTTIHEAGAKLAANAERYLKAPAEMQRLFADAPDAIAASGDVFACIDFTLDQLKYEYPHETVPAGWTPQSWLEEISWAAAGEKNPNGVPPKLARLLALELTLIGKLEYAAYFLTVYDIVAFARAQQPPILCQGRGSAANSAVCFLLGITSVDPVKNDLLFSRFLSEERAEPPDIDVDFEHERREEVMQYVYRRFGRHRAGIAATVIHYRPKSTLREAGKALGLSEDVTARLSGTIWGSWGKDVAEARLIEAGFDPGNPDITRLRFVVDQLLQFPRHLSQHVGGFILTQDRLDETVPIHNAAMKDRTFIEWDKDDIDALGLMKVDVLALGMLTCIRKSFDLMRENGLADMQLNTIPADDPAVYDMLCKGDSIGVFQVESRAQINMLPRLRPREFYDLVVQVAIVRPGPIEGEMVHPYLRRRSGIEPVTFPAPSPPHDPDELRSVLGRTFGVPLFQEQAMKLAIVAAAFTAEEANGLRRAMATFRNVGTIDNFRTKLVGGMMARGYEQDFAERCFKQIEGFGSYGFPESHAQSFARLVYVSSWIKCHYPAAFTAALLNSQPMGFYAPAQLVRDASEHGIDVLPIDINASDWDSKLEGEALRLGMRQIDGFRQEWANAIMAARKMDRFTSIEMLARCARLSDPPLRLLADADAFRSIDLDRRQALWEVHRRPGPALPLFAAADARELATEPDAMLPAMPPSEHVAADYQVTRLSLKAHPMTFLRDVFRSEGVLSCAETGVAKNGARVKTAGVVLIRQRPGKGNAVFITIEDETGVTNILLWARLLERQRRAVMASRLMLVEGEIQRSKEGVVHLMATNITDRTDELARLSAHYNAPTTIVSMMGSSQNASMRTSMAHADEVNRPQNPRSHPRNVRILPRSRDFH